MNSLSDDNKRRQKSGQLMPGQLQPRHVLPVVCQHLERSTRLWRVSWHDLQWLHNEMLHIPADDPRRPQLELARVTLQRWTRFARQGHMMLQQAKALLAPPPLPGALPPPMPVVAPTPPEKAATRPSKRARV